MASDALAMMQLSQMNSMVRSSNGSSEEAQFVWKNPSSTGTSKMQEVIVDVAAASGRAVARQRIAKLFIFQSVEVRLQTEIQ